MKGFDDEVMERRHAQVVAAEAVAAAVVAERERCAKIAEANHDHDIAGLIRGVAW